MNVKKLHTLTGHKDCVYALAENPAKPGNIYSGAGDGMVVEWSLGEPEVGKLIAKVDASVYAIASHSYNNTLIIGQNYDGIHLIDAESFKKHSSLKMTDKAIFDIASYNKYLLVADGGGTITVVDSEAMAVKKHLKASDKSARCIAVNETLSEFAVGYSDHSIRIFNLDDFSLKKQIAAHKNSVFALKYSPDNQFLLSGSRDANLKVWSVNQDYELHTSIVAHMYCINNIAFREDGVFFATASVDKSIKIWRSSDFKLLKVLDKARFAGHGTSVNKLAWTRYQNQLVSCSDDRSLSIWEIHMMQKI
ncbi:MAG: WD40 repeat domain-containing protein [Cyclobacteriaceae bacterium]|nr:WD40 repeat domain-containing protein [Cyclobacteriaceae bacterium]